MALREGGILFEWGKPDKVVLVEIDSSGELELSEEAA
jgi:hypothetical protein